jgi:phosphoribosylanthranilate isomerase
MLLKVCGATSRDDITLLADAGVDQIGLWHGVPRGPADQSQRPIAVSTIIVK